MPCEKPLIIDSLEDCCFTCYDTGRAPYQAPLAIVLHEYDGHIEELNNRMEACCNLPQDCHSSFHYGVGDGGQIYGWVDPEDTAWSFDPIRTDPDCGICDWNFGMTQGSQHPNLYTINIAVATGIKYISGGKHRSANVIDEKQYNALAQLIGWLADTYGITVNQNMIWRHCDELTNFDALCEVCNYSDLLEAVQECIDTDDCLQPPFCDQMCDCPPQEGSPQYVLGFDEECETCGRYRLDPCELLDGIEAGIFERLRLIGTDDQGECVSMEIEVDCNTTETISSAFGVNSNGVPGFYPVKEQLTHRNADVTDTLIPSTDRIIRLDATNDNVIFNLAEPGSCDPKDFWIKRIDCNSGNTIAINGVVGQIDNSDTVFLGAPTPIGAAGASIHVYWNGTNWDII